MGEPRTAPEEGAGRRMIAAGTAAAVFALAGLAVVAETDAAPSPHAEPALRDTTPEDTAAADTAPGGAARAEAAGDTAVAPGDTSVVYRREVFDYPVGQRRNPFEPVDAGEDAGPRLEDLTLTGILYSPDAGSVAVLIQPDTGRRYRLRPGDRIGDARLLNVTADRAVFRVEAFGFNRRTVLRLQQDEERSP